MEFLYGFGCGILAGGALSYLYASKVIAKFKAEAAAIKKAL
jgi:hypothetical protein